MEGNRRKTESKTRGKQTFGNLTFQQELANPGDPALSCPYPPTMAKSPAPGPMHPPLQTTKHPACPRLAVFFPNVTPLLAALLPGDPALWAHLVSSIRPQLECHPQDASAVPCVGSHPCGLMLHLQHLSPHQTATSRRAEKGN